MVESAGLSVRGLGGLLMQELFRELLTFVEGNLQRLFTDRAAVDQIIGGLRKAGFR